MRKKKLVISVVLAVALPAVEFLPSSAIAEIDEGTRQRIRAKWYPFLVDVNGDGMGVIVNLDPIVIATAAHVVDGSSAIYVRAPIIEERLGKRKVQVKGVHYVDGTDVAFLLLDYSLFSAASIFPPNAWPQQPKQIQQQQSLIAASFPLLFHWTHRSLVFEADNVSVDGYSVAAGGKDPRTGYKMHVVGTGVRLYPGDSGAPVFDEAGELVGLVSAFIEKRSNLDRINLATPASGSVPVDPADFKAPGVARRTSSLRPPPLYPMSAHAYRYKDGIGMAAVEVEAKARCVQELDRLVTEAFRSGKLGKLAPGFEDDSTCEAARAALDDSWRDMVEAERANDAIDSIHERSELAVKRWTDDDQGSSLEAPETIREELFGTAELEPRQMEARLRERTEDEGLVDAALMKAVKRRLRRDTNKWVFASPLGLEEQVGAELVDGVVAIIDGEPGETQARQRLEDRRDEIRAKTWREIEQALSGYEVIEQEVEQEEEP